MLPCQPHEGRHVVKVQPIKPRAELFAHGADIGVRGLGPSRATAFEQAGLALMMAVTEPSRVAPQTAVEIQCEAPNDAILLMDWLNALIYEMSVRQFLFGRFAVVINGERLVGQAWGEPVNRSRHTPAVEPKGATLTLLKVETRRDGTWVAQCVVDV